LMKSNQIDYLEPTTRGKLTILYFKLINY